MEIEPKATGEHDNKINQPLQLAVTIVVVLLILFGLYWMGRVSFYDEPLAPAEPGSGDLPVSVAECDEIYTDLLQALIDSSRDKKLVCGFDISASHYLELKKSVSSMKDLIVIRANDNTIEELPTWIGELRKLRVIELRNNKIETIPAEIKELRALEVLDLRGNPLKPGELAKTQELVPQAKVLY